jgi:hypothetical protein
VRAESSIRVSRGAVFAAPLAVDLTISSEPLFKWMQLPPDRTCTHPLDAVVPLAGLFCCAQAVPDQAKVAAATAVITIVQAPV